MGSCVSSMLFFSILPLTQFYGDEAEGSCGSNSPCDVDALDPTANCEVAQAAKDKGPVDSSDRKLAEEVDPNAKLQVAAHSCEGKLSAAGDQMTRGELAVNGLGGGGECQAREHGECKAGQLPKFSVGNFEVRVTERSAIEYDFRKDHEELLGSVAYSRMRFYKGNQVVRFGEALKLLAADTADGAEFRRLHMSILAGNCEVNPYTEYFWEWTSVSLKTLNSAICEFVCVNAPGMHKNEANAKAFADKLASHNDTEDCLQFMTPSPAQRATNLLVPPRVQGTDPSVYRSIASFFRGASKQQMHRTLQLLGARIPERMKERSDPTLPLWVSTAGCDLAWIHFRLDNKPKCYRFKEYKTHSRGGGLKSLREGGLQACVTQVGRTACESCGSAPFIRVRFFKRGIPLMWGEVIEMWVGDTSANTLIDPEDIPALRSLCAKVFAGYFWEAKHFAWECTPVSEESLMTTVFEFVAVLTPGMHKTLEHVTAFEDKFLNLVGKLDCLQFMQHACTFPQNEQRHCLS